MEAEGWGEMMEVKRETWTDNGDLELEWVKCSKLGWSERAGGQSRCNYFLRFENETLNNLD